MLHFGELAADSEIRFEIKNYDCFGNGAKEATRATVSAIVGYDLTDTVVRKELIVINMEVFWLQMNDVDFSKAESSSMKVVNEF